VPRQGPAYPISPEWQERVRARIDELGWSQNELARRAKISKSSLSKSLADGAVQSTCMRELHAVLGWPPPVSSTELHVLEAVDYYTKLDPREQGRILEQLRAGAAKKKR
jgi:transcriptional regulator with XRE-family HTH domain